MKCSVSPEINPSLLFQLNFNLTTPWQNYVFLQRATICTFCFSLNLTTNFVVITINKWTRRDKITFNFYNFRLKSCMQIITKWSLPASNSYLGNCWWRAKLQRKLKFLNWLRTQLDAAATTRKQRRSVAAAAVHRGNNIKSNTSNKHKYLNIKRIFIGKLPHNIA